MDVWLQRDLSIQPKQPSIARDLDSLFRDSLIFRCGLTERQVDRLNCAMEVEFSTSTCPVDLPVSSLFDEPAPFHCHGPFVEPLALRLRLDV